MLEDGLDRLHFGDEGDDFASAAARAAQHVFAEDSQEQLGPEVPATSYSSRSASETRSLFLPCGTSARAIGIRQRGRWTEARLDSPGRFIAARDRDRVEEARAIGAAKEGFLAIDCVQDRVGLLGAYLGQGVHEALL